MVTRAGFNDWLAGDVLEYWTGMAANPGPEAAGPSEIWDTNRCTSYLNGWSLGGGEV